MSEQQKEDRKLIGDKEIDSNHLNKTPTDIADEFILSMAKDHGNNEPLLDRLFSFSFVESEDYTSFFNRLLNSKQVEALLNELTIIDSLSEYFEHEEWANNPMIDFFLSRESPLRYIRFETFQITSIPD